MADPLDPSPGQQTEPEDHRGTNWRAVGVILALLLSVPAGYQLFNWVAASRDAKEKLAARDTAKAEYERLQAEHKIAQDAARQKLDAATAAQQEVGTKFGAEMAAARKILEEKNFTVRLTGPARVQPGAPNTWHIEAVDRGGRPAKPSKLEIAVKDATGAELAAHDGGRVAQRPQRAERGEDAGRRRVDLRERERLQRDLAGRIGLGVGDHEAAVGLAHGTDDGPHGGGRHGVLTHGEFLQRQLAEWLQRQHRLFSRFLLGRRPWNIRATTDRSSPTRISRAATPGQRNVRK